MSVSAYPAYKDSGVEWIGEMPLGWKIIPLKYVVSMKSGEQITAEHIEESGEYPVFGGNGLRGYTSAFTHDGHFPLIGRQGALCGNINYATGKFWASEHAVVVSPRLPCAPLWLGELLRSMDLGQYSVTAAQPGLSVEAIGNLRIPVPPTDEQSAIATFLDHETGKIDALVAEQERLMALLKEKRQAVISQAVTKGLDPSVPMRDSGVEWLGDVPKDWRVIRIKHFVQSMDQGWSPQCENFPVDTGQNWGVLKVGCVNGGSFSPHENKALPADLVPLPDLGIAADDVLISRANTRELVGSAACVAEAYPNLLLCDKLYRVRVDSSACNPRLLAIYLGSKVARGRIELEASGASQSMVNIAQSTILELAMPLPPTIKQEALVGFIDRETDKIDELMAGAQRSIVLLTERRAALISAAVTGKIDVRGVVPDVQQAA